MEHIIVPLEILVPIEEIPTDWGCPNCDSQRLISESIEGTMYQLPITGLWGSDAHGTRAYLDTKSMYDGTRGISTTIHDRIVCLDCKWSKRTHGDMSCLRKKHG